MKRQYDKPCGAQKAGAEIVDEGVWPLADLAQLFRETPPRVLASCWTACLLDSLIEAGAKQIGDLARALNVVAVKLNHRPQRHQRVGKRQAA